MASFTDKKLSAVYKDILHTDNSNTGISTTVKQIKCGDGDSTSLYLSNNQLTGEIPKEIGKLNYLRCLYLSNNFSTLFLIIFILNFPSHIIV